MNTGTKIAALIGVAALCAAAGVWGTDVLLSGDGSESAQDQERQAIRVGTAAPEVATVADDVSAVGTIRPVRAVEVRPPVSGRVVEVAATSGAEVREGDVLLRLDARAERAALAEAEATLRAARQERARIEELTDSNAVAERQLEEARAAYVRAEAVAMAARAALEDRTVTAPFAGTLGLVSADPGQILDTSTTIAPLSDLSVVRVDFALPERYFSRVGVGQAVDVITPAYPDQTFRGEVTVRAPVVEDDSRSFIVRAEIDNSDRRLVGGMFARTQLVFDTYDGLAVPDDAIISEGTATYVFTVSDGTATRTEVQTGASMGALTEITDGLSDGAQVVVTGWDDLSDGASVEVAEEVAREGLQ